MESPVLFIRCVKEVKIKYRIPREVELKGNTTRAIIKKDMLKKFDKLNIEVHAITVRKANVESKLRRDTNILYNYVVGLSLAERVLEEPANARVHVNVDRRIISITSGFKFNDYLRYKIWYEGKRPDINLKIKHLDSHEAYAIQGIDVICNSVFKKYSSNNYTLFNIIHDRIKSDKRLYFG